MKQLQISVQETMKIQQRTKKTVTRCKKRTGYLRTNQLNPPYNTLHTLSTPTLRLQLI